MKNLFLFLSLILCFLTLSLLTSCDAGEDEIKRINLSEYSEEDQLQFGENLARVLEEYPEEFKLLDENDYPSLYNYLNEVYHSVSNTDKVEFRELFSWKVTIVKDDSKEVCFAAPGGRFYIYTGMLKFLTGEHELASIMNHEIYYADKGINISKLQNYFSGDPYLLGDIYLGYTVPEVLDVIHALSTMNYNVEQVSAADQFAMGNICPFAYNAIGLKEILIRANSSSGIEWSETRPATAQRIDQLGHDAEICSNIEEDPTFSERYAAYLNLLP